MGWSVGPACCPQSPLPPPTPWDLGLLAASGWCPGHVLTSRLSRHHVFHQHSPGLTQAPVHRKVDKHHVMKGSKNITWGPSSAQQFLGDWGAQGKARWRGQMPVRGRRGLVTLSPGHAPHCVPKSSDSVGCQKVPVSNGPPASMVMRGPGCCNQI